MHIAILTIGIRGDVQPLVALGVGHRVTIATFTTLETLVCRHGLDFTPIVGDLRELAKAEDVAGWQEAGRKSSTSYLRSCGLSESRRASN